MNNYGEALKELRQEKGYSQRELAKATGISQANISRWENNLILPTIDMCAQLAQFYGITIDELVGIADTEKINQEHNTSMPAKIAPNTIAFTKDFGDMFTDKNYIDMSKLYKAISPELRALTLGYIIGILQRNQIDTTKIIGY